jgi:hypothetical protein
MQQRIELVLDGGALLCGRDASGTSRNDRSTRAQMGRRALNRQINATSDLAPSHRARFSYTCSSGRSLACAPAL